MRRALALLVLFCLVPLLRAGDVDQAKLGEIHGRMQKFVDDGELAGAVTVVGRSSGVVHHDAVGVLTLESKEPMPKDALFRIASMTKPITSVGIMILVDEGKLNVDDQVEKHLPEFKGQMLIANKNNEAVTLKRPARPITIKDLMTHTSGMQSMGSGGLADLYVRRNRSLAEATLYFSQRPLEFEPGSKWSYCNSGIDTLGRLIEVASGMSYEAFLKQRIFDPLGMSDTSFYPTSNQLERLAPTYGKKDGKLAVSPNNMIGAGAGLKHPIPAGGLYSTGADLAKFYQMMLNRGELAKKRIVSEESVKAMTSVQTGDLQTGFSPGMSFGLGWGVVKEPKGVTASLSPGSYGHGGAFGTQGWLDPKRDFFAVLLIQRTGLPNADASQMRQALQETASAAIKD
jgi:CubicO group peptidase (beta-lactamase class C family)